MTHLKHHLAVSLGVGITMLGLAGSPLAQAGSGSLDRNFGSRGIVTTDINNVNNRALDVAIQSDGSIVAVGYAAVGLNGRDDIAITRYGSSGLLDSTFGVGGKVTTNVLNDANGIGSADVAHAVAIQADGKIVVTGSAGYFDATLGYADYIVVLRYNVNGSLDATFGTGGVVKSNIGRGIDVVVLSNGKILVAGSSLNRYNPDGSLDATFGAGGIVTLWGGASAMSTQSDGKIVVAYDTFDLSGANRGSGLARYNVNGSADTAFYPFGGGWITDLAIQADDKIVITGAVFAMTAQGAYDGYAFLVARHNTDGTRDNTFGTRSGAVVSNFGTGDEVPSAVTLQADGKVLVSGYVTTQAGKGYTLNAAVARYTTSGVLDTGFGSSGLATTTGSLVDSVAVQSDGKIVTSGASSTAATGADFSLIRYLP